MAAGGKDFAVDCSLIPMLQPDGDGLHREAPSNPGHLDLHKVVALAEQVGGLNHGFR